MGSFLPLTKPEFFRVAFKASLDEDHGHCEAWRNRLREAHGPASISLIVGTGGAGRGPYLGAQPSPRERGALQIHMKELGG